ncbi:hypothetical protein [Alkalicoccus chagannorensis]|uniref:hypothetical protein n=1 Tax=Alkalicoccus chagannorensis TaxID=427072 RepID=UPI000409F777|nr:hypothetical protein [Alkalicoccus chagannorensis]
MQYRSYNDVRQRIQQHAEVLNAGRYDLVIGVSERAMVPAYMAALLINVHCCSLEDYVQDKPLKKGSTRKTKQALQLPSEAERVLLVDYMLSDAGCLKQLIRQQGKTIDVTIVSIYADEVDPPAVDYVFDVLQRPVLFEWSLFEEEITSRACFDIDGVLCRDPSPEEDADGERYRHFLATAPPLFLPKGRVPYVVTSRLEQYRAETELWLEAHGVDYGELLMMHLPPGAHRTLASSTAHKADVYAHCDADLFVESSHREAEAIHRLTYKPVYSWETNELFSLQRPRPKLTEEVPS